MREPEIVSPFVPVSVCEFVVLSVVCCASVRCVGKRISQLKRKTPHFTFGFNPPSTYPNIDRIPAARRISTRKAESATQRIGWKPFPHLFVLILHLPPSQRNFKVFLYRDVLLIF